MTSGHYVRTGSLVYVKGLIGVSSKGSNSGSIKITGLPFAPADHLTGTAWEGGGGVDYWSGLNPAVSAINIWAFNNGLELIKVSGSGSTYTVSLNSSDVDNGFSLRFSATYTV